jgi:hypothetical protein
MLANIRGDELPLSCIKDSSAMRVIKHLKLIMM